MKLTIRKKFTFDAGHHLPSHPGKCREPHGHTFTLWVEVEGEVNPETGMVMDFMQLKEIVNKEVIAYFDHKYLNQLLPNPTAENIGMHIYNILLQSLQTFGLGLKSITLAETEGNEVIVTS